MNGILDTLIKTARNEGIMALQKGLGPALGFQVVMNGIRLGMYDNIKGSMTSLVAHKYRALMNIVSSGLVGFVGGFLGSPFNLLKTRIML